MARYSQQNFTKLNPSGDVGAVFPGGVEIPAADVASPPAERRVQWASQADGSVVAEVYGWHQGEPNNPALPQLTNLQLQATSNDIAFARMSARHAVTQRVAAINATIVDTTVPGDNATVSATAYDGVNPSNEHVIVDDQGRSHFPVNPVGSQKVRYMFGRVDAAGNKVSGNFQSCSRLGVGTFQVVYGISFTNVPFAMVMAYNPALPAIVATLSSANTAQFQVRTHIASSATPIDVQFGFLVMDAV